MPTLRLDGDASGAVRATADLNAEAKKLVPTFREITDATDKAGQSHVGSFGPRAISDLMSYAAGLVSVGTAVGFVTTALREQAEEKRRIAQLDESAAKAAGRLSAVGGNASDLAYARQLHATGIVDSDVEGIHAVTGFRQGRLTGNDQQYVAKLADEMLIDPTTMGEYAQGIQAMRRAQGDRAGSFQTTEKEIRKAAAITRFSPEDIALQATRLAGPGAESGLSQEEQLATLIVAANKSRNLKTGGTLAEKMVTDGDRFEGADAAEYTNVLGQLRGAGGEGIGSSLAHTDARLNAADAAADAKARLDANLAQRTSRVTSLYERLTTEREEDITRRDGTGFLAALSRAAIRTQAAGTRLTSTEEDALQQAVENPASRSHISDELAKDIRDLLKEQTEMMRSQDRSPPPPNGRQE